MVSERERGSEMVQFLVVVPLVLLVLAAALQVGAVMLSIDRLTADVTRACRQLDAAGLSLAADKERFVKDELLGAATQLQPDLLTVRDVRLSFDSDANSSLAQRALLVRRGLRTAVAGGDSRHGTQKHRAPRGVCAHRGKGG